MARVVSQMTRSEEVDTVRDDRMVWVRERTRTTLGLPEKSAPFNTGDSRKHAEWFLEYEEYRCLFVWNPDPDSEVDAVADVHPPTGQLPGKVLVFRKVAGVGAITASVADELSVSECHSDPWQQMWLTTQQVFLPLIQANAKDITGKVDAKKVTSDLQKLISSIQVTEGHTTAEFVLPDPPQIPDEDFSVAPVSKRETASTPFAAAGASPASSPHRPSSATASPRGSAKTPRPPPTPPDRMPSVSDRPVSRGTAPSSRPMSREVPLPPVGGSSSSPARPPRAPSGQSTPSSAGSSAPNSSGRSMGRPGNGANRHMAGSLRRAVGQEASRRDRERDKMLALETTALNWTRLIKSILKQDAVPDCVTSQAGEFPGPLYETELRISSAVNLASVQKQLQSVEVQNVLAALGESNPYALAFRVVEQDVSTASISAASTQQYVATLRPWFEKIGDEKLSAEKVTKAIPPTIHTLLLVWQNSKYYRSPKRLAGLIKKMCNEVIRQAQLRVDDSLLKDDPIKMLPQLQAAIKMCSMLRGSYLDAKHKADTLIAEQREKVAANNFTQGSKRLALWPARKDAPFNRINTFLDRCNDLTDIVETAMQYNHLETIVIGGPGGAILTAAATHVLDEYKVALADFHGAGINCLDVDKDPEAFDRRYLELKLVVKRLDRRLTEIFCTSFADGMTLPEQLKLCVSYKVFGNRDFCRERLAVCYNKIADMVEVEFEDIRLDLNIHSAGGPAASEHPVFSNQPPIAGGIGFLRAMRRRITEPMALVGAAIPLQVRESPHFVDLNQQYNELCKSLMAAEDVLLAEWKERTSVISIGPLLNSALLAIEGGMMSQTINEEEEEIASRRASQLRLKTPVRSAAAGSGDTDEAPVDQLPAVSVNFDSRLEHLVREARYMQHLGVAVPPDLALVVSEEGTTLDGVKTTLRSIVEVYDTLRSGLRPVERALFRERYSSVLSFLYRGVSGLTWLSHGTHDFVNEANDLVVEKLSARLATVTDNNSQIHEILESWPVHPAVCGTFKDLDAPISLEDFLARHEALSKQYRGWIAESSAKIRRLVAEVFKAGFVSIAAPAWRAYLRDLSFRVATKLHDTAEAGLRQMLEAFAGRDVFPLVVVRTELNASSVVTRPPLDEHTFERSVLEHVDDWSDSLLSIGSLVENFEARSAGTYAEFTRSADLVELADKLKANTKRVCTACDIEREALERFCFLVEYDIDQVYTSFMEHREVAAFGRAATAGSFLPLEDRAGGDRANSGGVLDSGPDGDEGSDKDERQNVGTYSSNLFGHVHDLASLGFKPDPTSPTLEEFDTMMRVFLNVQTGLDKLDTRVNVSWIRIDLEPVCAALHLWAQKWIFRFGSHVVKRCTESLQIIRDFFDKTQDLTAYISGSASDESDGADDQDAFVVAMRFFHDVDGNYRNIENKIGPLKRTLGILSHYELEPEPEHMNLYNGIPDQMMRLKLQLAESRKEMVPRVARQAARVATELKNFALKLRQALADLRRSGLFGRECSDEDAVELIQEYTHRYQELSTEASNLAHLQELTGGVISEYPELDQGKLSLAGLDEVYVLRKRISDRNGGWLAAPWMEVDLVSVSKAVDEQLVAVALLKPVVKKWDATRMLIEELQQLQAAVPLVEALRSDTMRLRHWKQILRLTGKENTIDARSMPNESLRTLLLLNPRTHGSSVLTIVQQAEHDVSSEALLKSFEEVWMSALFKFRKMKSTASTEAPRKDDDDDDNEMWLVDEFEMSYQVVKDNQISLQNMLQDKSISVFSREISHMQSRLRTVELVLRAWQEVQGLWEMLHSLMFQAGKLVVAQQAQARSPGKGSSVARSRRRSSIIQTRTSRAAAGGSAHSSAASTRKTSAAGTQGSSDLLDTSSERRGVLSAEMALFSTIESTFKSLLESSKRDPAIMRICCHPGRLQVLETMRTELLQVYRGTEAWLNERRVEFPRFYFLSSRDLMTVYASCTQPDTINKCIHSVFGDVSRLQIEEQVGVQWSVKGLVGLTGESVDFKTAWPLIGKAPEILDNILAYTHESLRDAVDGLLKEHEENWVLSPLQWDKPDAAEGDKFSMGWSAGDRLAETVVLAMQLSSTREITEAFEKPNIPEALKRVHNARLTQYKALKELGRHLLSAGDFAKAAVLTNVLVHGRDLVEELIKDPSNRADCFKWQSQLKYNWDKSDKSLSISVCNGRLDYGFEYVARTHSLVMTPLTERCYLNILQAVQCQTGAACVSVASSGKTSTIRQLGCAVGKSLYELDCGGQTEHSTISDWIKGMAASGTWAVFKHVEKLSAPVLAVMAGCLSTIYNGLRSSHTEVRMSGGVVSIQSSFACLMTFSPGSKPSASLPDCLRPFFRVTLMTTPDLSAIAEVLLVSQGFADARGLSRKLVLFYTLASDLLGSDLHDWGVRTLRRVLEFVGERRLASKLQGVVIDEAVALCNALDQYNLARMATQLEREQYSELFKHVFGNQTEAFERADTEDADGVYTEHIIQAAEEIGLKHDDDFCEGVEAVGELLALRRTVLLVGPSGSGKSVRWQTLQGARDLVGLQKTRVIRFTPSAEGEGLFGEFVGVNRKFKEGILPRTLRMIRTEESLSTADDNILESERIWIVLDGPMSPSQCTTFMTAMDGGDLQLLDGGHVPVSTRVNFICECTCLDWLQDGMIARTSIIRLEAEWEVRNTESLIASWAAHYAEDGLVDLNEMAQPYISIIDNVISTFSTPILVPRHRICLVGVVQTALSLFDSLIKNVCDDMPIKECMAVVEPCLDFSMMWAFGGIISTASSTALVNRKQFSDWWRTQTDVEFPAEGLIWDYFVERRSGKMVHWNTKVPVFKLPSRPHLRQTICVPTARTEAFTFVMQMLVEAGRPLLLVGPSGAGKSTVLKEKMRVLTSGDLADWLPLIVQTNRLMNGNSVWSKMEKHLDCRSEQAYFPKESSKGLMCLIEDINTATGSSTAEFVRQMIDHGGVFDCRTAVYKKVHNVSYMVSTDTLDDTQLVTQTLQRHFGVLACPLPDKDEVTATYVNLMQAQLAVQSKQMERSALQSSLQSASHNFTQAQMLVRATVDLHYRICTLYLDTMARAHYVYGPRDLDTMFFHLSQTNASMQPLPRASLLWATVCRDVYALRLGDSTDLSRFWDALEKTAHAFFGPELATQIGRGEDAPIFRSVSDSSGMLLHGEEETVANSASERRKLSHTIDTLAADCHAHHPTLNVHVHKGLLPQLSHMIRMLQRPTKKSNFLLIGTGANDLAQLAGFVCQFPLTHARNLHARTTAEFQEEFADLAMQAGTRDQKIMYVIDGMSCPDDMLATITDFVSSGDIISLLSADNHVAISTLVHPKLIAEGLPISHKSSLMVFLATARANLRVVITMPAGAQSEEQRYSLRHSFSPILECLDVIWCTPEQQHDSNDLRMLAGVLADEYLENAGGEGSILERLDPETRENAQHLFGNIHSAVLGTPAVTPGDAANQKIFVTRALFASFVMQSMHLWNAYVLAIEKKQVRLDAGLRHAEVLSAEADKLRIKLETEEVALKEKQSIAQSLLAQIGRESWSLDQAKADLNNINGHLKSLNKELPDIKSKHGKLVEDTTVRMSTLQEFASSLKDSQLADLQAQAPDEIAVAVLSAIVILVESPVSHEKLDLSWRTGGSRQIANKFEFREKLSNIGQQKVLPESLAKAKEFLGPHPESAISELLAHAQAPAGPASTPDGADGAATDAAAVSQSPTPKPAKLPPWLLALQTLLRWAHGAISLHTHLHETATPVAETHDSTVAEIAATLAQEKEVHTKVDALQTRIDALSSSYEKSTRVKNDQLGRVRDIREQLSRAETFLGAISAQRPLWERALSELELTKATALPRAAMAIAAQLYLGPFSAEFRRELLGHVWCEILEERGLPMELTASGPIYTCEVSQLATLLVSEDDICSWDECWSTDFVKLNHATLQTSVRFPVLVDPHGAGIENIVRMEQGQGLVVLDAANGKCNVQMLVRQAEIAWKTGVPILIHNIGVRLPAELYDILQMAHRDRSQGTQTAVGGKQGLVERFTQPEFDSNFCRTGMDKVGRIYLATRDSAFQPAPELASLLTVVNYALALDEVVGRVSVGLETSCGELLPGSAYNDWVELRRTGNGISRQIAALDVAILDELIGLGVGDVCGKDSNSTKGGTSLVDKVNEKTTLCTELVSLQKQLEEVVDPRNQWGTLSSFGARAFVMMQGMEIVRSEYTTNMQSFLVLYARVVEAVLTKDGPPAAGEDFNMKVVVDALLALMETTVMETHRPLVQVLVIMGGLHLNPMIGLGSPFFRLSPSLQRFVYSNLHGDDFATWLNQLRGVAPNELVGQSVSAATLIPLDEFSDTIVEEDEEQDNGQDILFAEPPPAAAQESPATTNDDLFAVLPVFSKQPSEIAAAAVPIPASKDADHAFPASSEPAADSDDGASETEDALPSAPANDDLPARPETTEPPMHHTHSNAQQRRGTMMGFGETVLSFDTDLPSDPKDLKLREVAFLCMPTHDDYSGPVSDRNKPAFLSSVQWGRLHALDNVIGHRAPAPTLVLSILQNSERWETFVKALSPELESIDQLIDTSGWSKPLDATLVKLLLIRATRPERLGVALHMAVQKLTGIVPNTSPAYRSALPHLVDELIPLLQAPDVGPGYVGRIVPIVLVQGPDLTSTIGIDYVETMAQARGLPRSKFERVVFLPGEHATWQDTLDAAYRKGCWLAVQNIEVLGDELADLWQCIQTVGLSGSSGRADEDMMLEEEEGTDELTATTNSASNFRLFLTTHIGAELPSILDQSSLLVTCEHSTNLQSTLVDAHRVLSGGNGGERLGTAITTPLERACISALCLCQSQIGTKLRDNMLQDAATGSREFFGADIAHAAREMPFMSKTAEQSAAAVVAGFAECATRLYSSSCENELDRTLCKLYVKEWFDNDPTSKLQAVVPAVAAALSGSSDEWLASMRDAAAVDIASIDGEALRLPDEGEEITDSLVSNACNVFNAAFKFNTHVGPVEIFENPGSSTAPTDLQSSIRILAESISSQLPKSLDLSAYASPAHSGSAVGKVLLQECELMNSRIQTILLRLHELDMRASNSEMPETNDMVKQLMALHRGRVPQSWLTHETKSAVHLYDWLGHLCAAAVVLQNWLEDATGKCPSALRLGYISNISGLLVAFRQDIVRNKGWDPEEAVIELEPAKSDSSEQDNMLPIEGVALVGGHWDAAGQSLSLSEMPDSQEAITLAAVCRQRPSRSNSSTDLSVKPMYTCPVYDGGKGVQISVMMAATSSENDLTKRGVRMEIPGSEAL